MKIVKNRKIYMSISALVIIVGLVFAIMNGASGKGLFNYDIQFTGGTSIEVNLGKAFDNDEVTNLITSTVENAGSPQVQKVGSDENSVIIKLRSLTVEERQAVVDAFSKQYGINQDAFTIADVSATISDEMSKDALLAVFASCIAMLLYVSLRFKDFKIGASAIIALCHDALVVLACYAVFRIPMNNSFIAAILTVLGYSINATIVIFDRIRENKRKVNGGLEELVDTSVTQSVTRSIFTSLTTFFTIFALYIFGVQSVKEFALPIVVGVICGTYSSVFFAGSVWYILSTMKKAKKAK